MTEATKTAITAQYLVVRVAIAAALIGGMCLLALV